MARQQAQLHVVIRLSYDIDNDGFLTSSHEFVDADRTDCMRVGGELCRALRRNGLPLVQEFDIRLQAL